MDNLVFLILFFLVFVPFILMNFHNIRKAQREMIDLLRETNQLLSEMTNNKKP